MKSIVWGERIVLCHAIPGFSDASELAYGKCSRCSLSLGCEAVMKRMELPASGAALQPVAVCVWGVRCPGGGCPPGALQQAAAGSEEKPWLALNHVHRVAAAGWLWSKGAAWMSTRSGDVGRGNC